MVARSGPVVPHHTRVSRASGRNRLFPNGIGCQYQRLATEHLTLRTVNRRDAELGDIIDRIAAAADRAFHLLMTVDLTGEHMHVASTRLAELRIAYGDLVREAEEGRWCLSPNTRRR
ncbi:hypothetical protein AB0L63_07000 [Nocardia sp. NPDC051990]|uniref:hypothetical protein n=1 Tax=Nocardia sp. NPDC051990 TaxID=3155285 RepID=UPI00343C8425